MKKEKIIEVFLITLIAVIVTRVYIHYTTPTTDLPEEYELITPDTPIQGEFKNGTLTIEFKH